jgi:hypothetical protein
MMVVAKQSSRHKMWTGSWLDDGYEQVIAGAGAGHVKQMALTVVNLFEIGIIGDILDALLRGNDLVVARHYRDGTKLQTLSEMHRSDRDLAGRDFDPVTKLDSRNTGPFDSSPAATRLVALPTVTTAVTGAPLMPGGLTGGSSSFGATYPVGDRRADRLGMVFLVEVDTGRQLHDFQVLLALHELDRKGWRDDRARLGGEEEFRVLGGPHCGVRLGDGRVDVRRLAADRDRPRERQSWTARFPGRERRTVHGHRFRRDG